MHPSVRRIVAAVVCGSLLLISSTAKAEGLNNLFAFVNGIVVAPTDPFFYTINPPDSFEDLPFSGVTAHIFGFPAGVLIMFFRIFMALGDLVFFPFWVFPVFSPEPDFFTLIPNVEYES
jgi:hypothetical protein